MTEGGRCGECGHVNQVGVAFCSNCGNPLRTHRARAGAPPSTLPEEVVPLARQGKGTGRGAEFARKLPSPSQTCPTCRSPAGAQDLFCRRCGARLVHRPLYCKRCGEAIDPDERFCKRCGLPLG
jgi:predicted amidophosphoribosyltransferase